MAVAAALAVAVLASGVSVEAETTGDAASVLASQGRAAERPQVGRVSPAAIDVAQADFLAQSKNGVFELTDLVVEEVAEGTGPASAVGQTLVVEFTSWIMEGGEPAREFDSTAARGGPWAFVLGQSQALKGWDAGLRGIQVGATWRLKIPPAMAYGERGFAGPAAFVPPGAWVMSEVTLLEIR